MITADVHDRVDAANESFNHNQVQLLNGATSGVVGSVLTVPVGPGDKVSAEVYAKYLAPTGTSNPAAAIGNLVIGAITGTTGTGIYEGAITSGYGSGGTVTSLINTNASSTEPMAFINLLFLPDDVTGSIATDHFAFKQITSASSNSQAILALDQPYEAPESGYVVVYLSNESAQLTEVYFDDLKVTVNEHPVIQTDDYYPGGLTFNSYQRVTAKENRYLYNQGTGDKVFNTERIIDLDLNLDMTKFRMYDPALLRFLQVDPLADQGGQESLTPYQYAFNNPIRYNDPLGDCPTCFNPGSFIGLYYGAKAYAQRLFGAATNLSNGTSGSNLPGASRQTQQIHNTMSTLNDAKTVAQGVVDIGEATAQAVNSIPGVEVVGDPLLAMYYGGVKGDGVNASMYAGGAVIPFVSGSALKAVKTAVSNSGLLRGALNLMKGSGTQAHHLIPVQALRGNKVVQEAVGNGFDFNGAINGIEGAAGFHTNHPAYNQFVSDQLQSFQQATGGSFTGQQAQDFLQDELLPMLRQHYDNALESGQSLNNYFKGLNN